MIEHFFITLSVSTLETLYKTLIDRCCENRTDQCNLRILKVKVFSNSKALLSDEFAKTLEKKNKCVKPTGILTKIPNNQTEFSSFL